MSRGHENESTPTVKDFGDAPEMHSSSSVASESELNEDLSKIRTGQHLDDQSIYHEIGATSNVPSRVTSRVPSKAQLKDGDIEKEAGDQKAEKTKSQEQKDPNIVTWEGPDDPENPKNWSRNKKWAATFVVSMFTFISPVSSSMVAPSLATIGKEFNITNAFEETMILSSFVLAYAVGPLILGPLSEIYGRVPVLQLANLVYLAFNTACGASTNKSQMIAFRFLSGLGGSVPLAVGGGVLSDAWKPTERGKAIAFYSLMPMLGPAIGPICGGFITEGTTWRWVFYATSIADAVIQVIGIFFLTETYPPKILYRKAQRLRKETGNNILRTEFEPADGKHHHLRTISTALVRPFRLITTQPIVQVLAIYQAFIYGVMYLVLSTFPGLWTNVYHQSIGMSGLNYISMAIGFFIGAQSAGRANDFIYKRLSAKSPTKTGRPEFRTPLLVPGSLLIPMGLFIYGWTAQYHTHWIGPNIGVCLFSIGGIVCFQGLQTYIVDAYTRYAASALAASSMLRSTAGFGFPLFAPYMYQELDYGWGNSLLAFIAIGLGIPAPALLWFFGERLRARSKFAAGGY